MPFTAPNPNRLWADLIVEELVRTGITHFYIAPGSRSTPLVTAVAAHEETTSTVHFDERGTAFMALGYARASGRAAAWVTTSGTALANGLPAVVEADLEHIPMILLTADRPPELRDTDANQTIRQPGLFGSHVRWMVDLPTPDSELDPAFVLTTIDQAVRRSEDGPVHVNCMFREPLAPERIPFDPLREHPAFRRWEEGEAPFTTYESGFTDPGSIATGLEVSLRSAERPLIVLGRLGSARLLGTSAIESIRESGLDVPILADISSQVRLGSGGFPFIPSWDALLYNKSLLQHIEPDLVLQFGRSPVSKRLKQFLESACPAEWVVVADGQDRIDPRHRVTRRISAAPGSVFASLVSGLASRPDGDVREPDGRRDWTDTWMRLSGAVDGWRNDVFKTGTELTEQRSASMLSSRLPARSFLGIGSSTPVRHMDVFASSSGTRVPVCTNRGASGIDGTIATACGYADGSGRRGIVFLGDLTLLHDLNSLKAAAERSLVVVVINNDGGGIFSYLPIRRHEAVFEEYFGTPHGLTFEHAARMFGFDYSRPGSIDEYRSTLEKAIASTRGSLVEIQTDRHENYEEQRRLLVALSDRTTRLIDDGLPE